MINVWVVMIINMTMMMITMIKIDDDDDDADDDDQNVSYRWKAACIIQKRFRKSLNKFQNKNKKIINQNANTQNGDNNQHNDDDDDNNNNNNDNNASNMNTSYSIDNNKNNSCDNGIIVNVINKFKSNDSRSEVVDKLDINNDAQALMNRKKLHLDSSIKSCLIIIEFLVCIRRHVLKESMLNYIRSALLLITTS
jgi:hypothetical protein